MTEEKKPESTNTPAPEERYFLIVVGDDSSSEPQLVECESLEAFTKAVDENVLSAKQTLHAYGFVGQRIQISSPSPVCTVEVNGRQAEVGRDNRTFEASGRITPLRKAETE